MNDDIDPQAFAELQQQAGADFVIELIETFADEGPQMLAALQAAMAEGDATGRRRAAHSIKSNAHTFGATRLAELARAIELSTEAPDAAALQALQDELPRALQALRTRAGAQA